MPSPIKHFVVLMLENHSFDHMLGCLQGPEFPQIPAGWSQSYGKAQSHPPIPLSFGNPTDRQPLDPPHLIDPTHEQICWGDSRYQTASMAGFAHTFVRKLALYGPKLRAEKVREYMTCHADGELPVLQGLAREFGVCTHWFSSIPGSTTPNRMFAHAGTSDGNVKQGVFRGLLKKRMIFDVLGADRAAWRVYYDDVAHLWLTGDAWMKRYREQFRRLHTFAEDVNNDQLPAYSFIEPRQVVPPWSSQHPSLLSSIAAGEHLIADIYESLANRPNVFAKTLFLIVYDEHGGYPDHVIPPGFIDPFPDPDRPNFKVISDGQEATLGNGTTFSFDRLGPRVPAVVVSPWIARASVYGWKAREQSRRLTFDHTSILATVARLTGKSVESARAKQATPLQDLVNMSAARTDYPTSLSRRQISPEPSVPFHEVPRGIAAELLRAWQEHPDGQEDPSARALAAHFDDLIHRA